MNQRRGFGARAKRGSDLTPFKPILARPWASLHAEAAAFNLQGFSENCGSLHLCLSSNKPLNMLPVIPSVCLGETGREAGSSESTPPHPGDSVRMEERGAGSHHPNLLQLLLKAGQCTQVLPLLQFLLFLEVAHPLRDYGTKDRAYEPVGKAECSQRARQGREHLHSGLSSEADPKARPAGA